MWKFEEPIRRLDIGFRLKNTQTVVSKLRRLSWSLTPLRSSKWFIHYTKWKFLLCKAGPSWRIFADHGSCRISRAVNNQHTSRIISIYQTTIWCKACPGNFPTNHIKTHIGYHQHSGSSGWRDYCWSFNAWAGGRNLKRPIKNAAIWVQTSTRKVPILLNINQISWFDLRCWRWSSGCRKYLKVHQMPSPPDVGTVQSFLGLIIYHNTFLQSLHNIRAPHNHLLGQNVSRWWSVECERDFVKHTHQVDSTVTQNHNLIHPNISI